MRSSLLADDRTTGSRDINGLQKKIDRTVKYCNKGYIIYNLNKTKIMVFKRIRKLQSRGRRYRYGQRLVVVKVFIYYLFIYLFWSKIGS